MDQLKAQLAATLTTQTGRPLTPDDILDYRPARDGGYNVVLTNYQKYRNIQPTLPDAPPPIPKELTHVYTNPQQANKKEITALARYLNIPHTTKTTKKQLEAAIRDYKRTVGAVREPPNTASPDPVAKPGHLQAHDVTEWES